MNKILNKIINKTQPFWRTLSKDERASGTLEMVLIIVIVLGILVIFRDNIQQLIETVFAKINAQVNSF